ncbi:MAG: calcium/sodium antiporter [Desulfatibacillaceae bacterium]|nr:calcium/sodium antiporter [Desulfatibacillaceae bacterium]
MIPAFLAVICGLFLLIVSAGRFVEGSVCLAQRLGVPPLLVGMVVVGFGTSAPEIAVSALAALSGSPGIAVGNAYGSNIANIGLILGITALMAPLAFQSGIIRRELPALAVVTGFSFLLLMDHELSRGNAFALLAVFTALLAVAILQGLGQGAAVLDCPGGIKKNTDGPPLAKSLFLVFVSLLVLLASSRLLVWGAVQVAHSLGVGDLVIGLTVVAVGTSLPELASSIAAVRKGEPDIAIGNVIGSNLFNTLAVVGIAGAIRPMGIAPEVLWRDMPVMGFLTLVLFLFGAGFSKRPGRINRWEGAFLLACYAGYIAFLLAG